jgi:hypothetical protein
VPIAGRTRPDHPHFLSDGVGRRRIGSAPATARHLAPIGHLSAVVLAHESEQEVESVRQGPTPGWLRSRIHTVLDINLIGYT